MIDKNLNGTIKAVEFPNLTFATKAELFKSLKENADRLIDFKKSVIRESDSTDVVTATEVVAKNSFFEKDFIYPVINTTKVMDSHNDVHMDGIWDVSIKNNKGNIYYVADHKLEIGKIIAYPGDVEVKVVEMDWSELGVNYKGKTEALMFKVAVDKLILKEAQDIITKRVPIQHSVRMQYVKVSLAINSTDAEFKEEKANYDKFIYSIVNQDRVEKQGYFWAVEEAKISREGSMVIEGSNSITPMIYQKKTDPSNPGSHVTDPANHVSPKMKRRHA